MSNRATILMYHVLGPPQAASEAKYCCLPERFADQMAWLSETQDPISLDTLVSGLDGRQVLAENAVTVTFDDGFASTFEHAMPLLVRYRIPATMFIVANRIGRDNDWMHQQGKPPRRLMDAVQIREMQAANVTIGSHTLTHPRLPECTSEQAAQEIVDSKARLEEMISEPVVHFAYPYGLYDDLARRLVEDAGYSSACSTRSGFNTETTDRFQLRRIEIFGSDRLWHCKQKIKFGTNDASWLLPTKYYTGRAVSRLTGKD